MDARLHPGFWRHDGYTLKRLREAIELILAQRPTPQAGTAPELVADLGAGSAPYKLLFERRGARYITCDIESSEGAEHLMEIGKPLALRAGSMNWVVSFQVLEHVWDLDWYLGECHRILDKDGVLLLSTHGTWLYHPHPTDYRRWTRSGLVQELQTRGFKVAKVIPVVGPLAWTTQFRALGFHHVLCKIPAIGGLLSALLCSLMHMRMIAEDWVTPQDLRDNNAAVYVVLAVPVDKP